MAMDLNFKLLRNKTQKPFITSDFPVVEYNQFMETQDWFEVSYTCCGWIGQQYFFPLKKDTFYPLFLQQNNYLKMLLQPSVSNI